MDLSKISLTNLFSLRNEALDAAAKALGSGLTYSNAYSQAHEIEHEIVSRIEAACEGSAYRPEIVIVPGVIAPDLYLIDYNCRTVNYMLGRYVNYLEPRVKMSELLKSSAELNAVES